MTYNYKDMLFMVIFGSLIGFLIGSAIFFRGTDRDYFELKDRCKGVIGIVEISVENKMIDFECVGGK